ncbi:MAG: hypothetical protein KA807_13880 [Prolixibacteraceae bacterium]|nr:hypothetical protein [Prolixibacteraceae bacterium]
MYTMTDYTIQETLLEELVSLTGRIMNLSSHYVSLEIKNRTVFIYLSYETNTLYSKLISLGNSDTNLQLSEALKDLQTYWQEIYTYYSSIVSAFNPVENRKIA